jgi:hypothetical protein
VGAESSKETTVAMIAVDVATATAANAVAMIAADAAEVDLAAEDPGAAESKGRLGAPFLFPCSRWRESSVAAP